MSKEGIFESNLEFKLDPWFVYEIGQIFFSCYECIPYNLEVQHISKNTGCFLKGKYVEHEEICM